MAKHQRDSTIHQAVRRAPGMALLAAATARWETRVVVIVYFCGAKVDIFAHMENRI
jgi:hypothetical protein